MKKDNRWLLSFLIGLVLFSVGMVFFLNKSSLDILINLVFASLLLLSGFTSLYQIQKEPVDHKKMKTATYFHIVFTIAFGLVFIILALTSSKAMLSTILVLLGIVLAFNGIGVLYEAFIYFKYSKTYRVPLIIEGLVLIVLAVLAIVYKKQFKDVLRIVIGIATIISSISYFIRAKSLYTKASKEAEYQIID